MDPQGLRITTWNVNGIRNPFGYQPWRSQRSFSAMFDILEADVVVMQETKIQRKDLRDDMVLVPGWDVFFSLPKHKKGYSGVAVYTRSSVCVPLRAEEGITGILTPPNSSVSFRDLPPDGQIGGYPTATQLSECCSLDATTLDSEGRCVILEFPAFVLIGTYCPANRDESRDEFRIGFLNALDARVRNLVALGKRVFLTGDLNIIREGIDTANAEEQMKRHGMTGEEYVSTPARRMLNQLLVGGKVIGERDEEKEKPIMWDICRSFHPDREGMFTCWDTKLNARPGNFGSRIDYVLFSENCKDWFCAADIQEGLMGSDHCPVYAVFKEKVEIDGSEVHIRDIMSAGMFKAGVRQRDWSPKDLLPTSAKLIPEFDRRRSIRDMFSGGSLPGTPVKPSAKRPSECKAATAQPQKRGKIGGISKQPANGGKAPPGKGQSSLVGFFKPKTAPPIPAESSLSLVAKTEEDPPSTPVRAERSVSFMAKAEEDTPNTQFQEDVIDPIVSKESWSKLLGKRVVPRCEHDEPCVSFLTKKAGVNCGRSFFMCPRPLGPSGKKEKDTQWRCGTFIWSSDWTSDNA